jgi:hypothetical protein
MKYSLISVLLIITLKSYSQSNLPLIKATSNQAKIYEQNGSVSSWGINPKIKLDVHSTGKLSAPIHVKFKTDIDSIS